MKKEQADIKWDNIKGRAKRVWKELNDEDFRLAGGSVEKLYDIIQQKVGESKDAIRKKLASARKK